jgi:hypothetical protein
MMRRLACLIALLPVPALADELGDKIRAVFERARGNLVRVKFDQPMPDFGGHGGGGGGGGTRKANVTGFLADENTVVVVSSALSLFGGAGGPVRMRFRSSDGEEGGMDGEEEEPSGFKAVLPDGTEVTLSMKGKDPETGFTFLRIKDKDKGKAAALQPVSFAPAEAPLGDPVLVVNFGGADLDYQPRFLLARTNSVNTKAFPVYGTMESIGEYQGGLAYDLKGSLIGVVAPTPRGAQPKREGEGDGAASGGMRTMVAEVVMAGGGPGGGWRGGARILSGKWVTQALATTMKKEEPKEETGK